MNCENRKETNYANDETSSVRRSRLVDYTKERRRDMPSSKGTPYTHHTMRGKSSYCTDLSMPAFERSPPMLASITESQHSFNSLLSASSSSFSVDEASCDDQERVEFYLKIPSNRTRRSNSSTSVSRQDLMIMCEQQSEGEPTRRRSSKSDSQRSLKRDGRRPSLIMSVLSIPDIETVKSKYNRWRCTATNYTHVHSFPTLIFPGLHRRSTIQKLWSC